MHDKKKFNPENVISIINKNDKINMIKLYIYKIIYNKNNKQIDVFLNSEIINKYKLNTYEGFNNFINQEEIEKLEQLLLTIINQKHLKNLKNMEKSISKKK